MKNNENDSSLAPHVTFRRIPLEYSWQWLHLAALISKENYATAVSIGAIQLFLALVGRVPILGEAVYSFFNVILGAGILLIVKDWLDGKSPKVSAVFRGFQDRDLLRMLTPLAIFSTLVTLATSLGGQFVEAVPIFGVFYMAFMVVVLPLSFMIMAYSTPIIIFKKENTMEAIKVSVRAVSHNLLTEVFGFVLFGLLLFVCIILLVAPVLMVFMPIAVSLWYIKYISVFENFDVKKSIIVRQTVTKKDIYIDKSAEVETEPKE